MNTPIYDRHLPQTATSADNRPCPRAMWMARGQGPSAPSAPGPTPVDRGIRTRNASQAGNAVAMVLLLLGVVSILGVGLLTRSTMDTRFSAAYKSHERLFSLADGAASIAYLWLNQHGAVPEIYVPNQPNQQSLQETTEFKNPFFVRKPDVAMGSRPESSAVATCNPQKEKGMYWPVINFLGIGRPPAGFEIDKFETQFWIAGGLVTTEREKNTGITKRQTSPRAQASVQVAVQKTVKK
jgi:hypothetical protein